MSLPVFVYNVDAFLAGEEVVLPREGDTVRLSGSEGRHAVSVKRITAGEQIELMDGHGTKAVATVVSTSGKDTLNAKVDEVIVTGRAYPQVTVVQALPKSERSELAIDLLTQGGADTIIPWEASRCIAKWQGAKKSKGVSKWRQAALAAAKQSRRATIPHISDPATTHEVGELIKDYDLALILHEDSSEAMKDILDRHVTVATESIVVIIGPEGGITAEEAEQFRRSGAHAVKLGPEVLRTASAGIVALAALGISTGRW